MINGFYKSLNNILLVLISMIFIVGGACNNGFSSCFLAIPFLILYFIKIHRCPSLPKMLINLFLTLICTLVFWNKPTNLLFYPHLNKEFEINKGWTYLKSADSSVYQLIAPSNVEILRKNFEKSKLALLTKNTHMTMLRIEVTHPDFSTVLNPVFIDKEGQEYRIFGDDLRNAILIGSIKPPHLNKPFSLQSSWTVALGNLMYWPISPWLLLERF
ncbi:hypothetical protein PCNPT3_06130 [Psychromonas sp. CNPT3]|nr:hypothetical protein PCNPT3_06130 [Psychromonas sp. CNPT3]